MSNKLNFFSKLSTFNRRRKYEYFMRSLQPSENQTVLDIGFWNGDYAPEINFLEKHYPHKEKIVALGLESDGKDNFEKLFPAVTVVTYDGYNFPFADNTFDFGWSNAVIEHVGGRDRQIHFVREMIRTCKNVFFTTPNKKFPFDLHSKLPFIHWFPKKTSDRMYQFFGKKWVTGDFMYLLTRRQIIDICREAGAGQVIMKRNKLFGFTMDFSIILKK